MSLCLNHHVKNAGLLFNICFFTIVYCSLLKEFFFSRLEPSGETEEYLTKIEVKIKLPEELKFVLIDESEIILKHHKLPALPVQNTVDKILDDYVETKSSGKSNDIRYND